MTGNCAFFGLPLKPNQELAKFNAEKKKNLNCIYQTCQGSGALMVFDEFVAVVREAYIPVIRVQTQARAYNKSENNPFVVI